MISLHRSLHVFSSQALIFHPALELGEAFARWEKLMSLESNLLEVFLAVF